MAAKFLLKVYRFGDKDIFAMDAPVSHFIIYCKSSVELRKAIRFFSPRAYKVRSANWFRKYFNQPGEHTLRSSLFKQKHYDILPVKVPVHIEKEITLTKEKGGFYIAKQAAEISWTYNNQPNL